MYGSVAAWRIYATARGFPAPGAATDADAAAALLRASDHIQYFYVAHFLPGYDETSPNVEPATYEAALLELETPGFFNKTYTPDQQKVLTGLKGITWTVIGKADGFVGATPEVGRVAAMLEPYLEGAFRIGLRAVGG